MREEREPQERNMRRKRLAAVGFFCLLLAAVSLRPHRGLIFTMLDVGQGDSLFLRSAGGTTYLIDGGSTDVSKVGTYRILPFLKSQGVGRVDYVAVTHGDKDHTAGIEELLQQAGEPGGLPVGCLLVSGQELADEGMGEILRMAGERGIPVRIIGKGDVLWDEELRLACLHPSKGREYGDKNTASLVFYLEYGEFSMALTGDLDETGEQEILKRGEGEKKTGEWEEKTRELLQNCDILKAGHHGSKSSSSKAWLEALSPSLTLISCGKDNSYGHPHEETLQRLTEAGSRVLMTTEHGAITVQSDGEGFTVKGYR